MSDGLVFYIGDIAAVNFEFRPRLSNGALGPLTNPTTVRMKVKSPSGAERTYVYVTHPEVVKDADGKYHIDVLCAESGDYLVRAIGTGAVPSGSPDQVIHVQPSKFKQPL